MPTPTCSFCIDLPAVSAEASEWRQPYQQRRAGSHFCCASRMHRMPRPQDRWPQLARLGARQCLQGSAEGQGKAQKEGIPSAFLDTIWPRDAQGPRQAGAQRGSCSASGPLDRGKHSEMGSELAGRGLARAPFLEFSPPRQCGSQPYMGIQYLGLNGLLVCSKLHSSIQIKMVAFLQDKTKV